VVFGRKSIEEAWPFAASNAAIRYRVASPYASGVRRFDCGPEWWAREITEFVHSRRWANKPYIAALEFGLNGRSVGFAFLVIDKKRHPDWASGEKANYQLVVMAGVHKRYQGKEDPKAPFRTDKPSKRESLAVTMFRGIEEFGRSRPEGLAGMWLQVRAENARAIACYEKIGFIHDRARGVDGVYTSEDKANAPTRDMRKIF
jgi:GNAT superfamily N-acetyltransferase